MISPTTKATVAMIASPLIFLYGRLEKGSHRKESNFSSKIITDCFYLLKLISKTFNLTALPKIRSRNTSIKWNKKKKTLLRRGGFDTAKSCSRSLLVISNIGSNKLTNILGGGGLTARLPRAAVARYKINTKWRQCGVIFLLSSILLASCVLLHEIFAHLLHKSADGYVSNKSVKQYGDEVQLVVDAG